MLMFKNVNVEMLTSYICIETQDIKKLLVDQLSKYYSFSNIVATKDYIYCKGDLPIALVAHTDTVAKKQPTSVEVVNGKMFAKNQILGADDRAGIYIVMELIKAGYRPTVIFCDEEEVGCIGAREFNKAFDSIDNVKLFVEFDKSGKNIYTQYDCDNKELHAYLETIGLKNTTGAFSDISQLCPHFGIAGINLGIGYYAQHSASEYLVLSEVVEALNTGVVLLNDANTMPKYDYVEMPRWSGKYSGGYDWWDDMYAYEDEYTGDSRIELSNTIVCDYDLFDGTEDAYLNLSADVTKIAGNYGLSEDIAYSLNDADIKEILSELEEIIASKLIDKAFESSIEKGSKKKKAI